MQLILSMFALKRIKTFLATHRFTFIILVLCSIPVWWNLLRPGMPITDDGDWMLIRFSAFHQELRSGQFPVRWLNRLNNGYGYPVATFLYPGFLYLTEIPKLFGFGFVDSIKIFMIGCLITGSLGTYINLKKPFGPSLALFGGLFYLYQPYILWDVYARGSVGEVLVFAVLPWIWWTIEQRRYWLTSVGYAALILAHNSLALVFIPILFGYQIIHWHKQKLWTSFSYLSIGIGLSAFFWLPALLELPHTIFRSVVVSNWSAYFIRADSFYLIAWGVGVLLIGILMWYRNKLWKTSPVFLAVVTVIGLMLSIPASTWFWKLVPLGNLIQFPFRFASIAAFTTPYLAVVALSSFAKKWQLVMAFCLLIILICNSIRFILPQEMIDKGEGFYATNESTSTTSDEYLPVWVKTRLLGRAADRIERIDEQTVQINTVYWPGFQIKAGDQVLPIDYSNEFGLMRVESTVPLDQIKVSFGETPLRLMADGISIVSLVVLFVVVKKKYG